MAIPLICRTVRNEVETKVVSMITDPKRLRKTDPGHPEECNVYSYYQVFAPQEAPEAHQWCTKALKGCVDCKKNLSVHINKELAPIREKRAELEKDKDRIKDILKEGAKKARGHSPKDDGRKSVQAVFN